MRTNLGNLTEVDNMSDILETDTPTVIGLLFLFWSYADDNSADGELTVSGKAIDRRTAPGFSDALRKVGWLAGRDGSLTLPNFNRHNGSSAKARALEAEAKRLRRAAKDSFSTLWESINGPGSWEANDLVWIYDFEKIKNTQNA